MASSQFAIGTFSFAGSPPFAGLVMDDRVIALHAMTRILHRLDLHPIGADSVLSLLEHWEHNFAILQKVADIWSADGVEYAKEKESVSFVSIRQLKVHPPVNLPRQIFCCGANYRTHVIDLMADQVWPDTADMSKEQRRAFATKMMDDRAANGVPYFFSKAPSAVSGAYDPIVVPRNVQKPDWELELAVVIGRPARHVRRERAFDYIAGYTIGNDISNRDLIIRTDIKQIGTDWVVGKCMPTYLPLGPYLVPKAFVERVENLRITLKLNGEVKQDEDTSDMIFDVARQLEYLTSYIQLWPGDVFLTGSPAGNGTHFNRYLRPGDVVESSITGLGTQRNECIAEG